MDLSYQTLAHGSNLISLTCCAFEAIFISTLLPPISPCYYCCDDWSPHAFGYNLLTWVWYSLGIAHFLLGCWEVQQRCPRIALTLWGSGRGPTWSLQGRCSTFELTPSCTKVSLESSHVHSVCVAVVTFTLWVQTGQAVQIQQGLQQLFCVSVQRVCYPWSRKHLGCTSNQLKSGSLSVRNGHKYFGISMCTKAAKYYYLAYSSYEKQPNQTRDFISIPAS